MCGWRRGDDCESFSADFRRAMDHRSRRSKWRRESARHCCGAAEIAVYCYGRRLAPKPHQHQRSGLCARRPDSAERDLYRDLARFSAGCVAGRGGDSLNPVNFIDLIARGVHLPPVVVGTWIAMGLLIVFAIYARRALMESPDPTVPEAAITLRSVGEVLSEWLDGFVAGVLEGHGTRKYVPFFGTLFMFILTANFLGLIPGMEPPTSDTDLTFAIAIICFVYYIFQGFKHQGLYYLRRFLGPLWWLAWF